MRFHSKLLGSAVAVALGAVATQTAHAHPSFINGGSINTKCGLETMFIDYTGSTGAPGTTTPTAKVNQDSVAPGTSTASNSKAVDPTSTSYNGSIVAELGASNPVIPKNGGTVCGPGVGGIMDGIKIGHGTMQSNPEKYNYTNGTARAFNPTQVNPATNYANTLSYYRNVIASDVMFASGLDADASGNPECAPASVSSNATSENYFNTGTYPGNNQAPAQWFNPNPAWSANGGVILCRPAVARVPSYTHDGIDIVPNVPAGVSGATSTTIAINVNDGYSPTQNYTLGQYTFVKGNFGQPTNLWKEVVYSTNGTVGGVGSYNQVEEQYEGGQYVAGAGVPNLIGTFQFIGNPYYSQFTLMKGRDGFHGSKPVLNKVPKNYPINPTLANGLAAHDMNGSPAGPAYEISPFIDYSSGSQASTTFHAFQVVKTGKYAFAPTSCARNIVVRPAVVDRAHSENSPDKLDLMPTEEAINTFFGGRTQKYQVGDAGKQNWWMNYVLLHRDDNDPSWNTSLCPIAARYDVVVMPSVNEIDTYLPGANFKKTAPCATDYYCGSQYPGTPVNSFN
jgi:hypothetical protein